MTLQRQTARAAAIASCFMILAGFTAPTRADLKYYTDPSEYALALSLCFCQPETVEFNNPGDISGPAELVTGDLNGRESIHFMESEAGGEDLITPSVSQRPDDLVEAADGGMRSLFIRPGVPEHSFRTLSARVTLFPGDTGFALINTRSEHSEFAFELGPSQNFFGILSTNGETFNSVFIQAFTDSTMTTRLDMMNVRDIGVETVPEPTFVQIAMLLGFGGIGILRARRARK